MYHARRSRARRAYLLLVGVRLAPTREQMAHLCPIRVDGSSGIGQSRLLQSRVFYLVLRCKDHRWDVVAVRCGFSA